MTIARRFNAGFARINKSVPEGRLDFAPCPRKNCRATRPPFSRPFGTLFRDGFFPALKRRAIVGSSRWDDGWHLENVGEIQTNDRRFTKPLLYQIQGRPLRTH